MRSPESLHAPYLTTWYARAPLRPLLTKEIMGVLGGRALWTLLLLLCPLVGYSFFQALALYGEASAAALDTPALASGLSPLDGVLVPTFGAFYVAVTLLFPFVAIRALGREKDSGALRLLVQLPYRAPTLVAAKMTAVMGAWFIAAGPALSALLLWAALGGHLHAPETANLVLGHVLYGLLITAIALFAASVSESSATAAIVTLAFTIGSWVLDFALAGQPGLVEWIARLSLTQVLRPFEQGLLSLGLVLGVLAVTGGFAALAAIWLHPGVSGRTKIVRSLAGVALVGAVLSVATQVRTSFDVTQDRRNSFSAVDERALATLREPLTITVRLASEDPRYVDLRRNVLSKLERAVSKVATRLAASGKTFVGSAGDDNYGEIDLSYGGRSATTRSTSYREILPLLYELAGVPVPAPTAGDDYPGYPLVANAHAVLPWFCGALPLLVVLTWWWSGRSPRISPEFTKTGGKP